MALGVAIVARWADQGAGSSGQTDVQRKTSVQVTQGAQVPESDPLPDDALVVPRGPNGALQLYRVSSKGALAPVQLTATAVAHGPTLSPNRKTIIYLRGTDTSKVRVMAADGTGDRKLFRKPPSGCENVRHLAWSPTVVDLLALVCVDTKGYSRIVLVHLDGTVQQSLRTRSNFADDPSFSPDGSKIAYWASSAATATSGSLFTIATEGGGRPQRLTDGLLDADPVWSPHGDQLAFTRSRAGGLGSSAICLISAVPGGSPIALVDLPGENSRPTWSPAGDKIAYVHAPAGSSMKDVWLKRVGSSVPPHALGISAMSMGTPIWGHR